MAFTEVLHWFCQLQWQLLQAEFINTSWRSDFLTHGKEHWSWLSLWRIPKLFCQYWLWVLLLPSVPKHKSFLYWQTWWKLQLRYVHVRWYLYMCVSNLWFSVLVYESDQSPHSPGEASADTYSPSDSYTALCFWQPTGSRGLLFLGPWIPGLPRQVANIIKSQTAARRRREIGGGERDEEERNITMAIFPVSCPSEPNQIFYYIILQFPPPISLGGPGASLELTGGHIGNQSRNRRRAQRASPQALARFLFGQELPHHVRMEYRDVNF